MIWVVDKVKELVPRLRLGILRDRLDVDSIPIEVKMLPLEVPRDRLDTVNDPIEVKLLALGVLMERLDTVSVGTEDKLLALGLLNDSALSEIRLLVDKVDKDSSGVDTVKLVPRLEELMEPVALGDDDNVPVLLSTDGVAVDDKANKGLLPEVVTTVLELEILGLAEIELDETTANVVLLGKDVGDALDERTELDEVENSTVVDDETVEREMLVGSMDRLLELPPVPMTDELTVDGEPSKFEDEIDEGKLPRVAELLELPLTISLLLASELDTDEELARLEEGVVVEGKLP